MIADRSVERRDTPLHSPAPPAPPAYLPILVSPLQRQKILNSPAQLSPLAVESARLLNRLVVRSKRASGIQLPVGFVRTEDPSERPPLARLVRDGSSSRGGRGGAVRLKLYLCLNLLAAHPPHDIRPIPARAWAETLALPDPRARGGRRVSDALEWLDDAKMIRLERHRGAGPTITLLDPTGTGGDFKRYRPYVSVPVGFWREQWITRLSGSAVALLIVLLDLQGGMKSKGGTWLTTSQRARYGLSDDIWTRASKELVKHGILTVGRVPQGRDFDYRRMRNIYRIDKIKLNQIDLDYPLNSLNVIDPM
jgi:hypothetical protein